MVFGCPMDNRTPPTGFGDGSREADGFGEATIHDKTKGSIKMAEGKFYEMTGLVHRVLDEQTFASGFRKRDLILTNDLGENPKYPKFVPFTFKRDRADMIGGLRQGQRVKVVFALEGRENNGRYYPDITGIKVEVLSTEPPPPADLYDVDGGVNLDDDAPF